MSVRSILGQQRGITCSVSSVVLIKCHWPQLCILITVYAFGFCFNSGYLEERCVFKRFMGFKNGTNYTK